MSDSSSLIDEANSIKEFICQHAGEGSNYCWYSKNILEVIRNKSRVDDKESFKYDIFYYFIKQDTNPSILEENHPGFTKAIHDMHLVFQKYSELN